MHIRHAHPPSVLAKRPQFIDWGFFYGRLRNISKENIEDVVSPKKM